MSRVRRGGAVLGSPIAHSLSPVLHRAAYDALGLTGWDYRAVECTEDRLVETLRALDAEGLTGASLTMPLKRAVMGSLREIDPVAATVGAANTVLFGDALDEWSGANTDVPGMVAALAAGITAERAPARAAVLGAGATAASALAALARLGVSTVEVLARRPATAAALQPLAESLDVTLEVRPWDDAAAALAAEMVVATTPAGATDGLAAAVPAAPGLLFDVVYAPWPTALAAAWSSAGGGVVGGIELLVEQAAEQVRLMTGREAPVEVMRAAGRRALQTG